MVVRHNIKRGERLKSTDDKSFWERERQANSVRRKSLDDLNYITIPLDRFPTHIMEDNPQVAECRSLLQTLSEQPIVNFTGYTNTDLKLEYGTSNITRLTEYDQNYTLLVRTLQQWADILCNAGFLMRQKSSWNLPSAPVPITAVPIINWLNSTLQEVIISRFSN